MKRDWEFQTDAPWRIPECVIMDLRELADEIRYKNAQAEYFEIEEAADVIEQLLYASYDVPLPERKPIPMTKLPSYPPALTLVKGGKR